jgi:hypothetical protein
MKKSFDLSKSETLKILTKLIEARDILELVEKSRLNLPSIKRYFKEVISVFVQKDSLDSSDSIMGHEAPLAVAEDVLKSYDDIYVILCDHDDSASILYFFVESDSDLETDPGITVL